MSFSGFRRTTVGFRIITSSCGEENDENFTHFPHFIPFHVSRCLQTDSDGIEGFTHVIESESFKESNTWFTVVLSELCSQGVVYRLESPEESFTNAIVKTWFTTCPNPRVTLNRVHVWICDSSEALSVCMKVYVCAYCAFLRNITQRFQIPPQQTRLDRASLSRS